MSSAQTPSPTRPRRESRFIEGAPLTGPELLQRSPTSNELFTSILSEMDECEKKRKHRDSNTSNVSVESFNSSNNSGTSPGSSPSTSHPQTLEYENPAPKEGRRSINFSRPIESLDERHAPAVGSTETTLASKVKGRIRALTVGKEKDVKPYPGT